MLDKQYAPQQGGEITTRRVLKPCLQLEKYLTGWQCSVCDRSFLLSRAERQENAMYGDQIPTRIRHLFEIHSCSEK